MGTGVGAEQRWVAPQNPADACMGPALPRQTAPCSKTLTISLGHVDGQGAQQLAAQRLRHGGGGGRLQWMGRAGVAGDEEGRGHASTEWRCAASPPHTSALPSGTQAPPLLLPLSSPGAGGGQWPRAAGRGQRSQGRGGWPPAGAWQRRQPPSHEWRCGPPPPAAPSVLHGSKGRGQEQVRGAEQGRAEGRGRSDTPQEHASGVQHQRPANLTPPSPRKDQHPPQAAHPPARLRRGW